MRAGKHQRETLVGNVGRLRRVQPLREELQLRGGDLAAAPAADAIDHLAAGDG